jgi:hypothetical protein
MDTSMIYVIFILLSPLIIALIQKKIAAILILSVGYIAYGFLVFLAFSSDDPDTVSGAGTFLGIMTLPYVIILSIVAFIVGRHPKG